MNGQNSRVLRATFGCLLAAFWVAGCEKKKQEEFPAAPSSTPAASASPATANPAAPAATAGQPSGNSSQQTYAQAEAALKARDYEKAVDAALVLQQQKLTEEQAQAARNQMVRLQQQLVAAGNDPKAKAAADRLRQAAAHR